MSLLNIMDMLQEIYDNQYPEDSDICYGNRHCECSVCYELKRIKKESEENEDN